MQRNYVDDEAMGVMFKMCRAAALSHLPQNSFKCTQPATMHSLKLCADGIDRKSVRLSWHGSLRIGEG
jgi:hypothetical protein